MNAKKLSEVLVDGGLKIVSGGTDTHLLLVDLTPKSLTGAAASVSLENANITCNKNGIPKDPNPPKVTSGIRLGTPAGTTRGFKEEEFQKVGELILETLNGLQENPNDNSLVESKVSQKVKELCDKFPIYR